jgi:hypothetical protein
VDPLQVAAGLKACAVKPIAHCVKCLRHLPILILLAGCSVEHGQVDFIHGPLFELSLGEYRALMFFSDSTVLRLGGSFYSLAVPFWILAAGIGCLAFAAWIFYRRGRHGKDVA